LIDPEVFATIVITIVFTTLVTPPMLRALFARRGQRLVDHTADLPTDPPSEGEQS